MDNYTEEKIISLTQSAEGRLSDSLAPRISALLRAERDILSKIIEKIEGSGWKNFVKALNTLNSIPGRVIITGMGKSGHIGKKVAATMSSLGAPAHFVHPSEASHGDLGMITNRDALIAFSNSGNTAEMRDILSYAKAIKIPVIGVTMGEHSLLAQMSDVLLLIPKMPEGCNLGLAPTTSTTAQLAFGDALSVGLSVLRDFDRDNFHQLHPGGSLGQSTTKITEIMKSGNAIPLVRKTAHTQDIVWEMANKGSTIVGVIDENNCLIGMIRSNSISPEKDQYAEEVMRTASPIVSANDSVATAVSRMETNAMDCIFVIENDKPIGIVKKP